MSISAVPDTGTAPNPASEATTAGDHAEPAPRERRRPTGLHLGTATVLLIGLVITAGLALGARSVHNTNEDRLLRQRVRETAAVLTAAIPNVQTPLASAAVLAEATRAQADPFERLMQPLVTTRGPFISASLWSVADPQPRALVVVGARPELEQRPPQEVERFLRSSIGRSTLTINNLLASSERRLGYAFAVDRSRHDVRRVRGSRTAEEPPRAGRQELARSPTSTTRCSWAAARSNHELLASSTPGGVLEGRTASERVPFGNSNLLLVMAAKKDLGGNLMARLPWGLAAGGLLLTLAGAFLVERLLRRRDHAETLASENSQLYKEQRTVAQTLQHSLLPDALPSVAGLALASRYVAGAEGVEIGGDWYDVMHLENNRIVFVVGDVSGRGLRAATTMAELRYAVRAYAMQGDPPDIILNKVSRLISVGRDGHFATAVCGTLDLAARRLTLANAAIPNPSSSPTAEHGSSRRTSGRRSE